MTGEQSRPRVAVVTGASSGIGEAAARRLADGGFATVLAARRGDELDRIVSEIERAGGTALAVPTDLADAAQTSSLVERALAAWGRVDVLVNNAGYGPSHPLEQLDRDALRRVFDVNLLSGMQLISALIPSMRAQGGGRIVNVSSLSKHVGAPFVSAYAATKGGMEAMSACLRIELAPWNISSTVVVPGFVDTPLHDLSREGRGSLKDDPSNPYRDLEANLDRFAQEQMESAVTTEEVAEVIWKAATVAEPRPRYFAPRSAGTSVRMLTMMPTRLGERVLRGIYGWHLPRKSDGG